MPMKNRQSDWLRTSGSWGEGNVFNYRACW